jgi:hypothetical protein
MMRSSVLAVAALFCLAGCALRPPAPPPTPTPAPAPAPAVPPTAGEPAPALPAGAETPQSSQPTDEASRAVPPVPTASTPTPELAPASAPRNPKDKNSVPRSPSKSSVPATAAASSSPPAPSAPAAAAPSAPSAVAPTTLDLDALKQGLRDTRAIGVFTKLSLKNQVDDLLASLKSFHQGQSKTTLAALRQSYELLLLKVVTLLQDGDPQLAAAVSSSRDALWALLADPRKFAQITFNTQEPPCAGKSSRSS